ncbi:MAG: BrnA antitoxin family protein [Rhodoferax sp.]|nr:BrnA antitoxin family protein [Rhodoferax sp.]
MKSASSRSEKPQSAKRKSTSVKSKTDWARLKAPGKAASPDRQHPEASVAHIVRGVVRRGLQPLPSKASISLRVDQDVLEWFKGQGPGYQTRINTVLRAFRDASV